MHVAQGWKMIDEARDSGRCQRTSERSCAGDFKLVHDLSQTHPNNVTHSLKNFLHNGVDNFIQNPDSYFHIHHSRSLILPHGPSFRASRFRAFIYPTPLYISSTPLSPYRRPRRRSQCFLSVRWPLVWFKPGRRLLDNLADFLFLLSDSSRQRSWRPISFQEI